MVIFSSASVFKTLRRRFKTSQENKQRRVVWFFKGVGQIGTLFPNVMWVTGGLCLNFLVCSHISKFHFYVLSLFQKFSQINLFHQIQSFPCFFPSFSNCLLFAHFLVHVACVAFANVCLAAVHAPSLEVIPVPVPPSLRPSPNSDPRPEGPFSFFCSSLSVSIRSRCPLLPNSAPHDSAKRPSSSLSSQFHGFICFVLASRWWGSNPVRSPPTHAWIHLTHTDPLCFWSTQDDLPVCAGFIFPHQPVSQTTPRGFRLLR